MWERNGADDLRFIEVSQLYEVLSMRNALNRTIVDYNSPPRQCDGHMGIWRRHNIIELFTVAVLVENADVFRFVLHEESAQI